MIPIEPCRGCGRTLYTAKVANLDVRCEVEPLDAQTAIAALLAGRELWKAGIGGLTPASPVVLSGLNDPAPPTVVGTHTCKAVGGRLPASQKAGGPVPPKAPTDRPAAPSVASSGPSTVPSGVPDAVKRPSEGSRGPAEPLCDACRKPCTPGTYWGFQHGATWIYAEHVTCP